MKITQEEDILFIRFSEGVVASLEEPLDDIPTPGRAVSGR